MISSAAEPCISPTAPPSDKQIITDPCNAQHVHITQQQEHQQHQKHAQHLLPITATGTPNAPPHTIRTTASSSHSEATLPDEQLLSLACSGALSGPNASIGPIHAALKAALRAANCLPAHIENVGRLVRRVRNDLAFLERCLAGLAAGSGDGAAGVERAMQSDVIQTDAVVRADGVVQVDAAVRANAAVQADAAVQEGGSSIAGLATADDAAMQETQVSGVDIGGGVSAVEIAAQTGADSGCAFVSDSRLLEVVLDSTMCDMEEGLQGAQGIGVSDLDRGTLAGAHDLKAVDLHPSEKAKAPGVSKVSKGQKRKSKGEEGFTSARAAKALTPARVQGLANNLRGYAGELLAAQLAPGVVAVGKRFHAIPCQASPAPGASHGAVVAARRQQVVERRKQQQMDSKARAAIAAGAAPGVDVASDAADKKTSAVTSAAEQAVVGQYGDGGDVVGAVVDGMETRLLEQDKDKDACSVGDGVVAAGVSGKGTELMDGDGGGGGSGVVGKEASGSALLLSAEVDVVCQGGGVWLEVKNQEPFSVDSEHWHSDKTGIKGLRRQVSELLSVSAAPCNQIRWQAPKVVVLFPSGADPSVVDALRVMGAVVVLGMESLPTALPEAAAEPTVTNLDTTTMCALVSQVSWQPSHPTVVSWASRTPQWRECVTEEIKAPLIPQLSRFLSPGRELVAADVAVDQFQTLVDMFAGEQERQRWNELRARLTVVRTHGDDSVNVSQRLTGLGELREVGTQQIAVFGVGDARRAVTLTANGAAVRSADRQGVHLEAFVHRAVWLTGL